MTNTSEEPIGTVFFTYTFPSSKHPTIHLSIFSVSLFDPMMLRTTVINGTIIFFWLGFIKIGMESRKDNRFSVERYMHDNADDNGDEITVPKPSYYIILFSRKKKRKKISRV